ncbi:esterase/lipase family protein [Salinimonas lutimaris]|uniref:esterase/lipase family protein n=1 Tax=Salinimonas lutimaris TaxID=914153 RepID=UPI0010BF778A|nr:triacylglycerol lipase [Salinimonas lutimaris]
MKRLLRAVFTIMLLISVSATASTDAQTRYPIVLVHGLFGFEDILFVDYFYKVPQKLSRHGAQVFIAEVSPANSSEVRGEQLLAYIDEVRALTGAQKVNLIGHSHGGPTARYAASVAPHKVASVTSVGGVNWGSQVADVLRQSLTEGSVLEGGAALAADAMANLIELFSGSDPRDKPTSSVAALNSLSTDGSVQFNQRYPEGMPSAYCRNDGKMLADNGVYYFSWSGGKTLTNALDVSDGFLTTTGFLFDEPNDGLVSTCSSHLGKVLKDNYRMNHLDEVNQSFGITHWFETNPVDVYVSQAVRLKALGL